MTIKAHPVVNTKGLVFWYKMWGVLGTYPLSAFDYSLEGNSGEATGLSIGSYPGWLFANGRQLLCGSEAAIDNIWDGGGTFAGWLRPTDQGKDDAGRVLDKSTNTSIGWLIYCPSSDTTLQFTLVTDTTAGEWTFPFDVTGDIWQHVVLTYNADASANNPIVYINGVSVDVTETGTPNDTRTSDAAADLYVSARSAGGYAWHGKMGDLMLYNRILTAEEAKSLYEITRWRYSI